HRQTITPAVLLSRQRTHFYVDGLIFIGIDDPAGGSPLICTQTKGDGGGREDVLYPVWFIAMFREDVDPALSLDKQDFYLARQAGLRACCGEVNKLIVLSPFRHCCSRGDAILAFEFRHNS